MNDNQVKRTVCAVVRTGKRKDEHYWLEIPFRKYRFGDRSINRMVGRLVGTTGFKVVNMTEVVSLANEEPDIGPNYWPEFKKEVA